MKVAVVGGGISGLSAVWLLNEHSEHEVQLFESNDYVGGHTNTVEFKKNKTSEPIPVDTGFIVFNSLTYPNFLKFLDKLGIDYIPSNMSFSFKRSFEPLYEWSGNGLRSLFVGVSNLGDLTSQVRMVWDIIRFNHFAVDVLNLPEDQDITIDKYLIDNKYSNAFRQHYLLPMVASIWSTPVDKTGLLFPMRTLVRFMLNHHLLQITNQPQWLTIKNGSKTYVDKILSNLDPKKCFNNTKIESVSVDEAGKVFLRDNSGRKFGPFDHVIFGSHADQTMEILNKSNGYGPQKGLFDEQIDVLSQFKFSKNRAVLHNDLSLMPRNREVWASWNYITAPKGPDTKHGFGEISKPELPLSCHEAPLTADKTVSLTYWMNLLQSIPEEKHGPVLVTLNPPKPIDPKFVFGSWDYDHWMTTSQSIKAQKRIGEIQGKDGLSFVGAWTKYGFHEDGFTSALKLLVQDRPEIFKIESPIGLTLRDEEVRSAGLITRLFFTIVQNFIEITSSIFLLFGFGMLKNHQNHKVGSQVKNH